MYTRCPSCRAEISFEPPANMESLPDGYKHRIKCPSCGVTIGVKINKIDTAPATLVQQAPAYTQPQTNFEPVYTNANEEAVPQKKVKAKHSGVGRNVTMMIMSLLFIALSVVGYLVNTNAIKIKGGLYGIGFFDGISSWNLLIQNPSAFASLFSDVGLGIITIVSMVLFTLAGINFIVALVSACGKKYGRAYNLIMSIILAAGAIVILFVPMLYAKDTNHLNYLLEQHCGIILMSSNTDSYAIYTALESGEALTFMSYIKDYAIGKGLYLLFAGLGLGVLQLLFGLCFCKSLKRKEKKVR